MSTHRVRVLLLVVLVCGLVASGSAWFVAAARASSADCTFDNFACAANRDLGHALQLWMAAVAVVVVWGLTRALRRVGRRD